MHVHNMCMWVWKLKVLLHYFFFEAESLSVTWNSSEPLALLVSLLEDPSCALGCHSFLELTWVVGILTLLLLVL